MLRDRHLISSRSPAATDMKRARHDTGEAEAPTDVPIFDTQDSAIAFMRRMMEYYRLTSFTLGDEDEDSGFPFCSVLGSGY